MKTMAPIGKQARPAVANAATIERAAKIAIDALEELGIRNEYSVLVGGEAFDRRTALAVGADAYCRHAWTPVRAFKR